MIRRWRKLHAVVMKDGTACAAKQKLEAVDFDTPDDTASKENTCRSIEAGDQVEAAQLPHDR